MVEMALVMPILLFLALGIVDFGRAMNYWNDVNQIAADGARFAAVNKNPGEDDADPSDRPTSGSGSAQPGGDRRAQGRRGRGRHSEPDWPRPSESTTGLLAVGHREAQGLPSNRRPGSARRSGNPIRVVVESSTT